MVAAVLLALATAAFLLALEELALRRLVNRRLVLAWLNGRMDLANRGKPLTDKLLVPSTGVSGERVHPAEHRLRSIPTSTYALSQRQLVGAISASIQAEL